MHAMSLFTHSTSPPWASFIYSILLLVCLPIRDSRSILPVRSTTTMTLNTNRCNAMLCAALQLFICPVTSHAATSPSYSAAATTSPSMSFAAVASTYGYNNIVSIEATNPSPNYSSLKTNPSPSYSSMNVADSSTSKPAAAPAEATTPFFDFRTKMRNNDLNQIAAKEAEAKALQLEGLNAFKRFENEAIQNMGKEVDANLVVYVDKSNGFAISVPPSWTTRKKDTPTPTMEKFQEEKVLLTGNSFAEGSSLSVTRTLPGRLLKDFDVEWWYAPLSKITDMGSPESVANLLILQRQGDFERTRSSSEIGTAAYVKGGTELEFDFLTPLAQSVKRKTIVRAIFVPASEKFPQGRLDVVWVSALSGVFDSEYGQKLYALRDSFSLTQY